MASSSPFIRCTGQPTGTLEHCDGAVGSCPCSVSIYYHSLIAPKVLIESRDFHLIKLRNLSSQFYAGIASAWRCLITTPYKQFWAAMVHNFTTSQGGKLYIICVGTTQQSIDCFCGCFNFPLFQTKDYFEFKSN